MNRGHVEGGQNSSAADRGSSVNTVRVDLGSQSLWVIAAFSVLIGTCGLVMGLNLAKQDQLDRDFRDLTTAYKLEERRKMDLEAYFEVNGLKVPGDDSNGPTGNIQRMKPKGK